MHQRIAYGSITLKYYQAQIFIILALLIIEIEIFILLTIGGIGEQEYQTAIADHQLMHIFHFFGVKIISCQVCFATAQFHKPLSAVIGLKIETH